MSNPEANNAPAPQAESRPRREPSVWNVPNALCAIRLAGTPLLVLLALRGDTVWFVWLMVFLLATDWLDGKLAILLKQQTTFGARLDSVADASLYTVILFGALWLKWPLIRGTAWWIAPAAASYGLPVLAAWLKFGRLPSYHTRAAKTCWFLVSVAAVCLFLDWSLLPLRITAVGVLLTNLEALAITLVLPAWRANVPSLYHAWKIAARRD